MMVYPHFFMFILFNGVSFEVVIWGSCMYMGVFEVVF